MAKRLQPEIPRLRPCKICGRAIPRSVEGDLCNDCLNREKYNQIRDYLRTHDATEFELSEEFDIPLSTIREWIQDGRLEYKKSTL